jgi:23S rRNA pseudouridine2604 synthase
VPKKYTTQETRKNKIVITHPEKSADIRLNKYISEKGICSRREADKLIEAGRVTINGVKAETGKRVLPEDIVRVDGIILGKKEKPVYIAFNKPVGITCTTETKVKNNIIDFIKYPKRIFPIGRLDKDSQGLIFLTNDGDVVNKILRAGNNHEKEYIVTVDKFITSDFILSMSQGVKILGTLTKKCFVQKEGKNVFRIILTQGLNRQIRRMCQALGYKVIRLERIRIMNVTLDNIPVGKWRYLLDDEIKKINQLILDSIKTEEASIE